MISEQKQIRKMHINHTKLMTNYACHIHHLQQVDAYYIIKASCEIAASSLKEFLNKGRKGAKNA